MIAFIGTPDQAGMRPGRTVLSKLFQITKTLSIKGIVVPMWSFPRFV